MNAAATMGTGSSRIDLHGSSGGDTILGDVQRRRNMLTVKYRSFHANLIPRRTKLDVPGWAGQPEPRTDGSHEYPWHCIPFAEAARSGIELTYPHDSEMHVSMHNGSAYFETKPADAPRPPFRTFGKEYYTYQVSLDLKVEPGFAIKMETHPRFYTDTTGTVPIAVPAMVRHWWPMIYFVVFKTPSQGQTHIFRPGEPFMQLTIIPADTKFELVPMPAEEAAERELQSERIYASRSTLSADTRWTSSTKTIFDGTYRRIFGAAKSVKDR
jgi:hypothetical protein